LARANSVFARLTGARGRQFSRLLAFAAGEMRGNWHAQAYEMHVN